MNIYVGNLDKSAKKTDLLKLFEPHGKVVKVSIARDKKGGASRGFGFVEMESRDAGDKAVAALNEEEFMGKKLRVNEALEREGQEQTSGKGGRTRLDHNQRGGAYQGRSGAFDRSSIGQRGGKRGG
jgi:RNA recognition motif-containing protein